MRSPHSCTPSPVPLPFAEEYSCENEFSLLSFKFTCNSLYLRQNFHEFLLDVISGLLFYFVSPLHRVILFHPLRIPGSPLTLPWTTTLCQILKVSNGALPEKTERDDLEHAQVNRYGHVTMLRNIMAFSTVCGLVLFFATTSARTAWALSRWELWGHCRYKTSKTKIIHKLDQISKYLWRLLLEAYNLRKQVNFWNQQS